MNFEDALRELKQGKRVTRTGWAFIDAWLEKKGDEIYLMWPGLTDDSPDVEMSWVIIKEDLLTDDWIICTGEVNYQKMA